jgi:hypothetical protein
MTSISDRECKAGLIIKGEYFPCDMMTHMSPESNNHEGWAHANSQAQAIWVEKVPLFSNQE